MFLLSIVAATSNTLVLCFPQIFTDNLRNQLSLPLYFTEKRVPVVKRFTSSYIIKENTPNISGSNMAFLLIMVNFTALFLTVMGDLALLNVDGLLH